MENKFGIYDLVAYIIPGSISLFSILLLANQLTPFSTELLKSYSVIIALIFISGAYIIGQISGSFTKYVTRKIGWNKIVRTDDCDDQAFLFVNMKTKKMQISLLRKIETTLHNKVGIEIDLNKEYGKSLIPSDIQRIIKRVVENDSLLADGEYLRLVASRSFCGNSALSMFIFSIIMAFTNISMMMFSLVVMFLLLKRQVQLDVRIWREVYNSLLIYDNTNFNIN